MTPKPRVSWSGPTATSGTSFLPGRSFTSPADFNTQLTNWLASVANPRQHAITRMIPVEALIADRSAMAALPPVAPTTGTTTVTRLGRDYYVSVGGNAYSVHPEAIGRMITVTAAWTGSSPAAVIVWSLIMKGSGAQPDWHPIPSMSLRRRSCGSSSATGPPPALISRSMSKSPI